MHRALVRLSSVVVLAVPLTAFPALALAAAPPAAVGTALVARPATDASPAADGPAVPPEHGMDGMEGMDHSDPWAVEHSHDEAPVDQHDDEHSDEHGSHTAPAPAPPGRPRTEVLSAFGALNGAVLFSAALLRHRERKHPRHRPRGSAAPSATNQPRTSR